VVGAENVEICYNKKRMKFTAAYKKTKGWYVGWVEEVPGVNTQGKTLREVKENLREALALVIETNRFLNKTTGKVTREAVTL